MDAPSQRRFLAAALHDRYDVTREIGRGGMAVVYLARDKELDRDVALKVLHPDLAASIGSERFLREIEIAAKLTHPHILPVHDRGRAGDFLYYTMPYLSGESLRDRLRREKQLPVEDALQITTEVADALGFAHEQGIVHRDIKPENVLFQGGHAVVADFGIARAVTAAGGEQLTETGLVVGTPAYMSPEQGAGSGELDGRSDLYSLACVLYEMLSGETPFTGPTPMAILAKKMSEAAPRVSVVRETVPAVVEATLTRTLARSPVDRYATASEFTAALRGEAVARPTTVRSSRRMWWPAVAAAVVVLGVGGGVVARLASSGDAMPPEAWVMAVAPFAPSTPDTALARLGRNLVTTMSTSLHGVGEIQVVDHMAVLSQPQPGGAGLDRQAAATMARRLGAGSVVHGSLLRVGPEIRLDFGVFTADSLHELARGSVTAPDTALMALSDSASWTIVRGLSGTETVPSLRGLQTASLSALRAFLDGEEAAAEGRWDDALAAYSKSVGADSTLWEAYFAFGRASKWAEHEGESLSPMAKLMDHFYELSPALQECWKADYPWNPWRDSSATDPPTTLSWYLAYYASAVDDFPNCEGIWWEYADQMVHRGSSVGYSDSDKQAALERAIQRYPQVSWFYDHLLWVTHGRDSAAVRRALKALARLEPPTPGARLDDRLMYQAYATGRIDSILADSVAEYERTHRLGPSIAHIVWALPDVGADVGRRILRTRMPRQHANGIRTEMGLALAARGNWDSAMTVMNHLVAIGADAELHAYRLATAGAWLGGLAPTVARTRRGAVMGRMAEATAEDSAEVWWLDGVLAATENDVPGLEAALAALVSIDEGDKRATEASLRALLLNLTGNTTDAARVLVEREFRDTDSTWGNLGYRGHPYVRSINRLAAARWLLAAGDTAQAQRLLVWHEQCCQGWRSWAGAIFAPLAYLLRGQIEEARGHDDVARQHYEQVLQRYDMPVPALRHVVTEAEAGIGRIAMRR